MDNCLRGLKFDISGYLAIHPCVLQDVRPFRPLPCSHSLLSADYVRSLDDFFYYIFYFLVADTRLYTLPCRSVGPSVGPSVRHIFEFRAVFALLLLPNRPRLDCRVSGLVFVCVFCYCLLLFDLSSFWCYFFFSFFLFYLDIVKKCIVDFTNAWVQELV